MRKINTVICFISLVIPITLLLLFLKYNPKYTNSYQVSRDCRGYNIEVKTLESWNQKITSQKLKVLGFSGWSINGEGVIKCVDREKSCSASIIRIYGTPEYIFKKDILTGTIGYEIQDNTCIISDALAQKLFGSKNIENENVIFNHITYSIACVVKDNQPFICLPLNEGKVDYVEIVLATKKNADKTVSTLLN